MVGAEEDPAGLLRLEGRWTGRQRADRLERGHRLLDAGNRDHPGAKLARRIVDRDRGPEVFPAVGHGASDGSYATGHFFMARQVRASDVRGLALGDPRRLPRRDLEQHRCRALLAHHNSG